MRIGIIGGGIGGLSLAHALRARGFSPQVFERDASVEQTAGYRLHLNASALAALERGVPSPLLQALRASGTGPESFTRFSVLDHHGRTCLRLPVSPEEDMLMIGRRPLRAILARDLGEQVRWGVRFNGYSEHADRVVVHLDGARDEEVDVLVGADGTRSRITRQLKGQEASRPAGIVGIAGKTPLTDVTSPSVPEALFQGPGFAIGPRGVGMFLSTHQPRPAEAQVRAELEPAYVVWSVAARLDQFSGPPEGLSPRALVAEAQRLLAGWSPRFHHLLEASEPESPAAFPFVFPATLGPWSSERVTLLGDAIHPMPPTAGAGASTAIVDAVRLAEDLANAPRAEALVRYQARMLGYAPAVVDEARPPLAWQRRLAHPVLRVVATTLALPLVSASLAVLDAVRAPRPASRIPVPGDAHEEARQ